MTKPQSLRAKILEILAWDCRDHSEDADFIISAIEHRLPEKQTPEGTGYMYNSGYNQAISEVKEILKGE